MGIEYDMFISSSTGHGYRNFRGLGSDRVARVRVRAARVERSRNKGTRADLFGGVACVERLRNKGMKADFVSGGWHV